MRLFHRHRWVLAFSVPTQPYSYFDEHDRYIVKMGSSTRKCKCGMHETWQESLPADIVTDEATARLRRMDAERKGIV